MDPSGTDLPFNRHVGIQRSSDAMRLLALPSGEQYLNRLGTVHAGALLALSEASSGVFLLRQFGSIAGVVPMVRRVEAKFRKPAYGRLCPPPALPRERSMHCMSIWR